MDFNLFNDDIEIRIDVMNILSLHLNINKRFFPSNNVINIDKTNASHIS